MTEEVRFGERKTVVIFFRATLGTQHASVSIAEPVDLPNIVSLPFHKSRMTDPMHHLLYE